MFELFEAMIKGHENYNEEDGLFVEKNQDFIRAASLYARENPENPFADNSDDALEFDDFMYFYKKWPKSKNDCAFKRMFLRKAEWLVACGNPYKKSVEKMKHDELVATEKNDIKTGTYIPVEKKVFGVKE